MLRRLQICVYQFCVVKPAVGLLIAILEITGLHEPGVFTATAFLLAIIKGTSLAISARVRGKARPWAVYRVEKSLHLVSRSPTHTESRPLRVLYCARGRRELGRS